MTRKRKAAEDAAIPRPSPQPPASNRDLNSDADTTPYQDRTDRSLIDRPVAANVHAAMTKAWAICNYFQMCILFDVVSPVRQFKRGTVFSENAVEPFPEYDRGGKDVTETDEEVALKPYKPRGYKCVSFLISNTFFAY